MIAVASKAVLTLAISPNSFRILGGALGLVVKILDSEL